MKKPLETWGFHLVNSNCLVFLGQIDSSQSSIEYMFELSSRRNPYCFQLWHLLKTLTFDAAPFLRISTNYSFWSYKESVNWNLHHRSLTSSRNILWSLVSLVILIHAIPISIGISQETWWVEKQRDSAEVLTQRYHPLFWSLFSNLKEESARAEAGTSRPRLSLSLKATEITFFFKSNLFVKSRKCHVPTVATF